MNVALLRLALLKSARTSPVLMNLALNNDALEKSALLINDSPKSDGPRLAKDTKRKIE